MSDIRHQTSDVRPPQFLDRKILVGINNPIFYTDQHFTCSYQFPNCGSIGINVGWRECV